MTSWKYIMKSLNQFLRAPSQRIGTEQNISTSQRPQSLRYFYSTRFISSCKRFGTLWTSLMISKTSTGKSLLSQWAPCDTAIDLEWCPSEFWKTEMHSYLPWTRRPRFEEDGGREVVKYGCVVAFWVVVPAKMTSRRWKNSGRYSEEAAHILWMESGADMRLIFSELKLLNWGKF